MQGTEEVKGAGDGGNGNGAGNGNSNRAPRTRASLSSSPLSRPKSLVHMLVNRVSDYIHFPIPDPLYVVLGTVAANMLKGMPVWTVMVGAPSAGKGVVLEMLAALPKIHIVGAFKGPAALLSGTGNKERAKNATGGLLRQVGSRGMLVMKDFTSMLSLAPNERGESIGALREIFDGRYSRPLGADGGKMIEWTGRVGFIAACTPVIDRHSAAIGDLGERWVYYRYPETDGYGETITSLGINDPQTMMEELRELITAFIEALSLVWEDGGTDRRDLERHEKDRLYAMASLVCGARSNVPRDSFHGNEVMDVSVKEAPPRIAGELGQLYLGLECIGLEEDERWRLIGKIAMDSVRQLRAMVIMALYDSDKPLKVSELREISHCGSRAMEVAVGDMLIHGIVKKSGHVKNRFGNDDGVSGGFVLSEWTRRQLLTGWKK